METIDIIINTVCRHTNIPMSMIKCKCRKREIVQARQLICFFAKKLTKLSGRQIGQNVGDISNSDVHHAMKTIQGYIDIDYDPNGFGNIYHMCNYDIMSQLKYTVNGSLYKDYQNFINNELEYYLTLQ